MSRLRLALLLAFINVLCTTVRGYAQQDAAALKARLIGKVLFLRPLCAGDNLRFNADGALIGTCKPESFTVGLLGIDKVDLTPSELHVSAHRIGIVFHDDKPSFVDLSKAPRGDGSHAVSLRIAAPQTGDYAVPLAAVLSNRYADLVPTVPSSWQKFFQEHLLPQPAPAPSAMATKLTAADKPVTQQEIDEAQINPAANDIPEPPPSSSAERQTSPGETAFRAGKDGVTVPKLLSKTVATFSPAARSMLYTCEDVIAIVIDEHGAPVRAQVKRPCGLGLDEQALLAIEKYKFAPSTKNGMPVPVYANIAVNFQVE